MNEGKISHHSTLQHEEVQQLQTKSYLPVGSSTGSSLQFISLELSTKQESDISSYYKTVNNNRNG